MMKPILFLCVAAVVSSTTSAHAADSRWRCDESGCRIDGHAQRNDGPRRRADCCQGDCTCAHRGQACAEGECCPNGQCRPEFSNRSSGERDDRYAPEAVTRHDFLYRPERADSRDRRLANPFRPAGYASDYSRDDRRPVPTNFETRRPVSRSISWQSSIQRAVDDAKRAGLPLLIQVSAEWCPHCVRMKRETYTDPQLASVISQRYVAVSVDADQQREFIQQMGIQSLPTTLVVAPDLRILNRLQGFQSANQIMQALTR